MVMKKIFYLLLVVLSTSTCSFVSCSSDEGAFPTDGKETKDRGNNIKRNTNVTFQDVKALVNSLQKGEKTETRATGEEKLFSLSMTKTTLYSTL